MDGIGDISQNLQGLCARHVPRLMREQTGNLAARQAIRGTVAVAHPGYQVGAPGTGDPLSGEVFKHYDDAVRASGKLGGIVIRARKEAQR